MPRRMALFLGSLAIGAGLSCAGPKKVTFTPQERERLREVGLMSLAPADQRRVYPHLEKLSDTALVPRSPRPTALRRVPRDLSAFRYTHKGVSRNVDEFMSALNVVGVIALKDGAIAFERYADGHDAETPWTAFSVTKSVTSLLFGVAIRNGDLQSLDQPVTKYLPELAPAYDSVSLRQLLQMSSGMAWNSNLADKTSDTYKLQALDREGGLPALLTFMAGRPRVSPPGKTFKYNTAEADLAGAILSRAAGRSLAELLTEHVWQPMGMEGDGHWVKLKFGNLEHGDCCLSARLRDYARLGQFALDDGVAPGGRRLLPEGWMRESTGSSPAYRGYGYFWWLRKGGEYFASGSFGQHIEVAPAARVVVAIQSYWPAAFSDDLVGHNDAFVAALIDAVR